ncbi:MAG: tyrosyl-tRNA synthetase, partial [Candidatus Berkelbacteria bacterium Licking1014_2]
MDKEGLKNNPDLFQDMDSAEGGTQGGTKIPRAAAHGFLLTRGVAEIIGQEELEKKLKAGQKLRIKHGVDPTTTELHLGHAVNYRKMRQFQNLGHTIVFLIGDFTARFGDPTDRGKTRFLRSRQEVMAMAKDYLSQAGRVIDMERAEIRYNGEWYDKMSAEDLLNLMSNVTYGQLIERDMFQERIKKDQPIFSHEMVYPILQGYDSVMLKSDLTVCGTDQKFNELMGRWLQEKMGQPPQVILTTPILLGADGKNKMSQSLGNHISLSDSPENMYGKIMSIADDLIVPYFELCTDLETKALAVVKEELKTVNPRDVKMRLAKLIVANYHDITAAEAAEEEFKRVFQERQQP